MGVWEESVQKFYSKLAELLTDKRKESKSLTVNWLRTKLCFGLIKSCLLCLRGSRSVNRNIIKIDDNMMATTETLEKGVEYVFIVNFEHISHFLLVFL